MNVYAFYDFGLSQKPQCIIDAQDVETARGMAAARGFHVHRLTALLCSVQIDAHYQIRGWLRGKVCKTRREALEDYLDTFENADQLRYLITHSQSAASKDEPLIEDIDDLGVEMVKYGL